MRDASVDATPVIDWGVAALALAGETESGDLHLVKRVGRGTLVAAVDGLGHGAEAAAAARAAVAAPRGVPRGPPPTAAPNTPPAPRARAGWGGGREVAPGGRAGGGGGGGGGEGGGGRGGRPPPPPPPQRAGRRRRCCGFSLWAPRAPAAEACSTASANGWVRVASRSRPLPTCRAPCASSAPGGGTSWSRCWATTRTTISPGGWIRCAARRPRRA